MIFTNMGLDELYFEGSKMLQRTLTAEEVMFLSDIIEDAEDLEDEEL